MLEGKKAVIFDMDGTLIDSMWMWDAIDIEYLSRFGKECPPDLHQLIEGMSFCETAEYFKNRFSIPDSLEKIKQDWNDMAREKYCYEVPLKEGAKEFLQFLKEKKIKLGIATSNSRELMELVLHALEIRHFFDAVHTSCEVAKGKPNPDIYLLVADKLEVHPKECLVFEDVLQGILAGKRAGMTVCAVEDKASKPYLPEIKKLADYYIRNYIELMEQVADRT